MLTHQHQNHSFIHSFIQRTYIAPLQDNLLRGTPSPTPVKKNSFWMLIKSSFAHNIINTLGYYTNYNDNNNKNSMKYKTHR